jgi:outer membrane protein assembly factor BamB/TolA-binding protein
VHSRGDFGSMPRRLLLFAIALQVLAFGAAAGDAARGLKGEYFGDREFKALKLTRVDPAINFVWDGKSPDKSIEKFNFTVRWTGSLQAKFSEEYTFYTISDDGVMLSVGEQLLIDNWTDHNPVEDKGAMKLEAGKRYNIKLEYFQGGNNAKIQLFWQSASQPRELIPESQFSPEKTEINPAAKLSVAITVLKVAREFPAIEKKDTWQQSLAALDSGGIPRGWLFLGPRADKEFKIFYRQKPLEPERLDDWTLLPRDETGKPFAAMAWNRPEGDDGAGDHVDMAGPLGRDKDVLAYARTDVDWPVAGDALLWYADDGRSVVFVNNVKVFENWNQNDTQKYCIPVKMNAGRNVFKIKVGQQHGGVGFNFRLERNDPEWRIGILNSLLGLYPAEASAWRGREAQMEIARQLEKLGKKEEAVAAYKKLRETFAASDEVRIAADIALERIQKNQADTKESREAADKQWQATEQKYLDLLRAGNGANADALLREWIARNPTHDSSGLALIYRGTQRMDAGMCDESLPLFLRAVREFPQNQRVREYSPACLNFVQSVRPLRHIYDTNHETQATLEAVRRQMGRGTPEDIERAIRNVGEVLRTSGDALVRVDDSPIYPRMVGAPEYVRSLLAAMSKDERAVYAKTVGSAAETQLRLASASGELAPLAALAEQFQYTPAAARALNRAGNLNLDRGAFAEAAAVFGKLLQEYRGVEGVSEPLLAAKLASALNGAGQSSAAQEVLARLTKDFGGAQISIGGATVSGGDLARMLQAKLGQSAPKAGASGDYTVFNYSLARTGAPLSAPAPQAGELVWMNPLPQSASFDTARAKAWSALYTYLQPYPVVAGGKVFVGTLESLQCIDLESGKVAWNRSWRSAGSPISGQFAGFPVSCPTMIDGRVYQRVLEKKQSSLRCYFAATGRPNWSSAANAELRKVIWLSDPVITSGLAIAVYMEPGDNEASVCGLAAMDALSGQMRWKHALESGRAGMRQGEEFLMSTLQLGPPSVENGVVYTSTGVGSVAAVKAIDGALVWMSGYPRAQMNNRERGNASITDTVWQRTSRILARGPGSPVIAGDVIVFAPKDSPGLLGFNRSTGALLWRNEILDGRFLAGVCDGNVLLADDTVRAIRVANGSTAWEFALKTPLFGSPAYSGGILCLPTRDGLQMIDAKTGAASASAAWDPRIGPLGNLVAVGNHLVGVSEKGVAALGPKSGNRKEWPLEEARALAAAGKHDAAAEKFAQAAASPEDALEALVGRVTELEKLNRAKDALGDIDRLLEGKPAALQSSSGAWRVSKQVLAEGLKARLGQPPSPASAAATGVSGAVGYAWELDADDPSMFFANDGNDRFWVYAGKTLYMLRQSARQDVMWKNYVGLDEASFTVGPTALTVLNRERLTLIDRGTGETMWSVTLQSLRDKGHKDCNLEFFSVAALNNECVAVVARDGLICFDLRSGQELWWNKQPERRILALSFVDGKLAEIHGHGDQKSTYNLYGARDGKVLTTSALTQRTEWTWSATSPDGRLCVFKVNPRQIYCIDLSNGQKKWEKPVENLEFRWEMRNLFWHGDTIYYRGENKDKGGKGWMIAELSPKDGGMIREYPTSYEPMGGNFVSVAPGDWSKINVMRADLDKGNGNEWKPKKIWTTTLTVDPSEPSRLLKTFLSTKGDRLFVLATYDGPSPRFVLRTFDWASGALVGEEVLPGTPFRHAEWYQPYKGRADVSGNVVLYTGADGLYALTPLGETRRDAAGKIRATLGDANLSADVRRDLRRSLAGLEAPTLHALLAPTALRPDGDWSKWELNDAIALGGGDQVVPLLEGAAWKDANDLSAKMYASWNSAAIYIAIDVKDDTFSPPQSGAELSSGDSIRVAINATSDTRRGYDGRDNLVCSLALVDGQPVVNISSGQGDDFALRPRGDVTRLPDGSGVRYRLALPWALLRRDPAQRPGDFKELRLGVAVFDSDGGDAKTALEWGTGASGYDMFPGWLGQLSLLDVSRERLERYKEVIARIPDTAEAMQYLRLLINAKRGPRAQDERIEEIENFVKANPSGRNARRALLVLRSLYKEKGEADASAKLIAFAKSANCAPALVEKLSAKENPDEKGTGLEGQYFSSTDLSNLKFTRIDPVIDFDFGTKAPHPSIGTQNLSVRWSGQVKPQFSESYTFYATSDDGVRLWIDDKLVIDSWIDRAPTEDSVTIPLTAGVRYSIKMEYFQGGGSALVRLMWSSKNTPKQLIPAANLFPTEGTLTGDAPGAETDPKKLQAGYRDAARLLADSPEGWILLKRAMEYYPADAVAKRTEECELFLKEFPETGSAIAILQTLEGLYPKPAESIPALMQAAKLPRDTRRAYNALRSTGWVNWNLFGPVQAVGENRGMDQVMEPEKNIDRVDLALKTKGPLDLPLQWTKVPLKKEEQAPDGNIDAFHWLVERIQGPARQELEGGSWFTYAYRKISVPTARRATMYFGVNDTISIWLNGKRVVKSAMPGWQKDSQAVEVSLKAGDNEIFLKAGTPRGRVSFYFRIADGDGRAFEDLKD